MSRYWRDDPATPETRCGVDGCSKLKVDDAAVGVRTRALTVVWPSGSWARLEDTTKKSLLLEKVERRSNACSRSSSFLVDEAEVDRDSDDPRSIPHKREGDKMDAGTINGVERDPLAIAIGERFPERLEDRSRERYGDWLGDWFDGDIVVPPEASRRGVIGESDPEEAPEAGRSLSNTMPLPGLRVRRRGCRGGVRGGVSVFIILLRSTDPCLCIGLRPSDARPL